MRTILNKHTFFYDAVVPFSPPPFVFVCAESEEIAKTLNCQPMHATANFLKSAHNKERKKKHSRDDDRIKQTNGAVGVKE